MVCAVWLWFWATKAFIIWRGGCGSVLHTHLLPLYASASYNPYFLLPTYSEATLPSSPFLPHPPYQPPPPCPFPHHTYCRSTHPPPAGHPSLPLPVGGVVVGRRRQGQTLFAHHLPPHLPEEGTLLQLRTAPSLPTPPTCQKEKPLSPQPPLSVPVHATSSCSWAHVYPHLPPSLPACLTTASFPKKEKRRKNRKI